MDCPVPVVGGDDVPVVTANNVPVVTDNSVPVVTVVTRVGCHLCTEAENRLAELSGALNFELLVIDVDSSRELANAYSDRVPVFLIDGREHGYWRLEEDRFRAALAR
jgi:glutaredoxin